MSKTKRHIMTDAEARAYIQGKPDEPTEEELEIRHVEYLVRNELRRIEAEPMSYLRYPDNNINRIRHYIDNHEACPIVCKLEDVLRKVKELIAGGGEQRQ